MTVVRPEGLPQELVGVISADEFNELCNDVGYFFLDDFALLLNLD